MVTEYCPVCGIEMYYIGGGYWKCSECGEVEYFGHDEDGESTEESLSADDASLIWGSRGKDEDYTFGYLEEDLEEELQKQGAVGMQIENPFPLQNKL